MQVLDGPVIEDLGIPTLKVYECLVGDIGEGVVTWANDLDAESSTSMGGISLVLVSQVRDASPLAQTLERRPDPHVAPKRLPGGVAYLDQGLPNDGLDLLRLLPSMLLDDVSDQGMRPQHKIAESVSEGNLGEAIVISEDLAAGVFADAAPVAEGD